MSEDQTRPTPDPSEAADDGGHQAGRKIDRYELVEPIGEGGMGTVWRARQREPVARDVALKIIKLGMDTREVVHRFEAERQALALMDHSYVAKVLDGGATGDGRPYFVMELVGGVPITTFCDARRLGLRARLELFVRVCEAVQHAHHKGIIHRDIKPSNVLVVEQDGTPIPKVIDFGVAKATSAELTQKSLVTQHDQLVGTPEYMSPEQAGMVDDDIDTRADIYSLGVLLYELLTGTRPFDAGEVLRKGYLELLRMIREVDPQKPSTRVSSLEGGTASSVALDRHVNVERLRNRLRGELDWIVMKSLEKDRARRYETANGFAADVSRFLRDEPVLAAPPSGLYRLRKFIARRKATVASVAVAAFLLVAGGIASGIGWWEAHVAGGKLAVALDQETELRRVAQENEERAIDAERAAERRAEELARVVDFQDERLGVLDVETMGARLQRDLLAAAPEERRDALAAASAGLNFTTLAMGILEQNLFDETLEAIDRSFGEQPLVRARLLGATAETLRSLGLHARALPPIEEAVAVFEAELGASDPETLEARGTRGSVLSELDRHDESLAELRGIVDARVRDHGPDHLETASAEQALAAQLLYVGELDEAEGLLEHVLEVRRAGLEPEDPSLLTSLDAYGGLLMRRGKYPEAEAILRGVLATERATLGDDHPSTITMIKRVGEILWRQSKFAEGVPFFQEAVERGERVLGENHPATLRAMNDLGNALTDLQRPEEALEILEKVVERKRRYVGERHTSTMISLNNIAQALEGLGRYDEALPYMVETVSIAEEVLGENHQNMLTAVANLAQAQAQVGDFESAVASLRRAHAMAERLLGEEHPQFALMLYNGAILLQKAGRMEEARVELVRADALLADVPPEMQLVRGRVRGGLGLCLMELERYPEAEEALRSAVALGEEFESGPRGAAQVQMLRNVLGGAVFMQGRFDEAQPLLVDSALWMVENALSETPAMPPGRACEACDRVLVLFRSRASEGEDVAAELADWEARRASVAGD